MKSKKTLILYFLIFCCLASLYSTSSAKAVCPICTIAVCAGVGLSRWLGIDDMVTGLWLGGLFVLLSISTIAWLKRKNFHFKADKIVISLGYYLIVLIPLYLMGIMGHPLNAFWGIDKLLFGIIIGSVAFSAGVVWHYYLKKKNNGRSYFPFQKVVLPIIPLVILSMLSCFLFK